MDGNHERENRRPEISTASMLISGSNSTGKGIIEQGNLPVPAVVAHDKSGHQRIASSTADSSCQDEENQDEQPLRLIHGSSRSKTQSGRS